MTQEDYIKIPAQNFGLVQRKYKMSQEEAEMLGVDLVKQSIAAEIGRYLLNQGLLNFKQEGDILIADLYVVKIPKGNNK